MGLRTQVRRQAASRTSSYAAFISYSHALDGVLAPALQSGLEQFAKPWYQPRALRVFRDTTSLTANPGLWSSIEKALASSSWLVLMASPDAARSPWVNREVEWWLANKSPQRVLVVLTEGEFTWADDTEHGNGTTAALPPALRRAFDEEPRWVDLRWLHDADQVDQSNPRLRECVADIAAAVRKVPKDELVGEHIRQHRRTMRLVRGGITTLAVLLIAAVVAAVVAVGQRNQAVAAQHAAIARSMMAQAEQIRDIDPRGALQLGVAAHQVDANLLTQASLTQTLLSSRFSGMLTGHTSSVNSVAVSPDGQTLATASADKTTILWDLTDRTHPRQLGQPLTGHTSSTLAVAVSPDGHTLATASAGGTVILWDLTDRTQPRQLGQPLTGHTSTIFEMVFSPDGHTLLTASSDQTVILWDLTDRTQPRQLGQLPGHTGHVNSVAFSPDGQTLATVSATSVTLWENLTDRIQPRRLGQPLPEGVNDGSSPVAFSPDGHTLATIRIDTASLWDLTDRTHPRRLGPPLTGHTGVVNSVAFSPDGQTLATISDDQTVILWDPTDRTHPRRLSSPLTDHTSSVNSVAFSPDAQTLATASGDRAVILWDLTPLVELRRDAVREACTRAGGSLDQATWGFHAPGLSYQDTCANY